MNYAFLALCAAVALAPLLDRPHAPPSTIPAHWPATCDGLPLHPVPLHPAEQKFLTHFPGAVARFTDGRREFIFRRIHTATRKLHPSAACFRALGYTLSAAKPEFDDRGQCWSTYTATLHQQRLRIRERTTSETDARSWTDVSAWYWSALLRQTSGPWLAVTIADPER